MRKMTNKRRKNNRKSSKQYLRKTSSKNKRKTYKKKIIGGQRYGTGVGSNCYDPNLSIFNTNLLKLFPYKPTSTF
jgi:ABC-type histidine transport system ATPase subunit